MANKIMFNPAIRMSLGLVMFTISVLLFADLFGLIPNQQQMMLEARKKVCESLAVQLSVSATKRDSAFMQATLRDFVERNDDVIAASMSKDDGAVLATYGEFNRMISNTEQKISTDDLVVVPIYSGEKHWGSVNVEFTSNAAGWFESLRNSVYGVLIFVLIFCFAGYYFILRRTLRILDPSAVVPDRVSNAFNTMSEGVLIIDDKEQILMVNDEFARKVDKDQKALIGMYVSSLNWKLHDSNIDIYPWLLCLSDNEKQVDVSMEIVTVDNGVRMLSVNCAPIVEEDGKTRGVLITVDDVTDIQETNQELEKVVGDLVEHQSEITRKNVELETLATRDALTGCYNRRAFFDHFEVAFQDARTNNTELSCVMADIDHFKSVNDCFGHAVGDEVIRTVADILNACQRDDAIVGRYGGEEFCVILPDTGIEDAINVAERLRVCIHAESKNTHDERLHVTASFGVAAMDDSVAGCSVMLDRADQALYVSKNNGRNRVSRWGQVVHEVAAENKNTDQQLTKPGAVQMKLLQKKIKRLEGELQQQENNGASHELTDAVSGLPSRAILEDRLTQSIAMAQRTDTMTVVTILNIDMFSRINTAMGEEVGDAFLREVGNRLKSIIRRSDTVASMMTPGHASPTLSRLRGDEFALIFSGIEDIESISYVVNRLYEKLKGKIKVNDSSFYISTSLGVSLFPNDGDTAAVLIDRARSAQKHTKLSNNTNIQFYSEEINQQVIEQMQLEVDMLSAVENEEFTMMYQPKLNLQTGEVVSAEALIRWQHPVKGMVAPFRFIPLAEKSGIIIEIGKWMMRHVCCEIKTWVDMGVDDVRVSVNVSAIEFLQDDFVQNVKNSLKHADLAARHLEIEITESALLSDLSRVAGTIKELHYLGVTVTLDDFGTGYSSFSYLGKLEFDCIKLDRSFLLEAFDKDRARALYESIVLMIRSADIKVVSEGIETQEQFDFIKGLGVDELQGYILSKPVEASAITSMIVGDDVSAKQAAG